MQFNCPHCKVEIDLGNSNSGDVLSCQACGGPVKTPYFISEPSGKRRPTNKPIYKLDSIYISQLIVTIEGKTIRLEEVDKVEKRIEFVEQEAPRKNGVLIAASVCWLIAGIIVTARDYSKNILVSSTYYILGILIPIGIIVIGLWDRNKAMSIRQKPVKHSILDFHLKNDVVVSCPLPIEAEHLAESVYHIIRRLTD